MSLQTNKTITKSFFFYPSDDALLGLNPVFCHMRRGPCVHGKTRQLRRRRWGEKSILRRSLLNGQWLRLLSWHNRYCGEADYICNDDPLHSHVLRIRGLRPIFTHVTLFFLSMCKRCKYTMHRACLIQFFQWCCLHWKHECNEWKGLGIHVFILLENIFYVVHHLYLWTFLYLPLS